jgi:predicted HTH transcriptional regulator
MDLAEVLSRPEGKRTEYKRDLSSPGPVLRTLVAFANTAGGTLVIGMEDGTRAVRGVDDPLAVAQKLADVLADGISPRLVPEIDIVPWRATQVMVVQVHLSPSRPHYLASAGSEEASMSASGRATAGPTPR